MSTVDVHTAEVLTDASPEHVEELLAVLDDTERERAHRKRAPLPFVTAHALLRTALAALLGEPAEKFRFGRRCPTCGTDQHGKPSLEDRPDVFVSLSYTDHLAVVAVSRDGEIGVDVEEVTDSDFGGFAALTLDVSEVAAFDGLHGDALLVARAQVWARKEAVLKATGHGLVVDPTEVLVSGPGEPARFVDWRAPQDHPGRVLMSDVDLPVAGYRAAVALLAADPAGPDDLTVVVS